MKELSIEEMFLELKENEDERIKKAILWCISTVEHEFGCKVIEGFAATELKSWLEKQGKNNMGISEATKKKLEDNLNKALEKETLESWNEFLEKQGEQKPIIEMITPEESLGIDSDTYNKIVDECIYGEQKPGKVEPKFHKGDWIVTNKNHIWYVDETPDTTSYLYRLINQYGKVEVAEFEIVDKKARLWTIQDAKDGDVLIGGEQLFLFKRMNTSNSFYAHCNYHFIGYDNLSVYDFSYSIDNICPATKEQRDLLFKKMKEAGYEWDAEHRQLRKIESRQEKFTEFEKSVKQVMEEADLEKEIDNFYGMYRKNGITFSIEDNQECVDWKVDCNPNFEKAFAKHFFELGMSVSNKAQKGE